MPSLVVTRPQTRVNLFECADCLKQATFRQRFTQDRICLEKPVRNWVYKGTRRSALDRFSYPVPNGFTCECDPVLELYCSSIIQANQCF